MHAAMIGSLFVALVGTVALGCEQADDEARQIEKNVEHSVELNRETYEEKRAAGEEPIEAAGEAYEAVIEEGREKAKNK